MKEAKRKQRIPPGPTKPSGLFDLTRSRHGARNTSCTVGCTKDTKRMLKERKRASNNDDSVDLETAHAIPTEKRHFVV